MSHWYDVRPTFTELGTSIAVARPAFVAEFFASAGLMAHAQAVFDAWTKLLPAESIVYYGQEKSKKLVKATPKATAKVRDALAPASIAAGYQWHFAKTAAQGGAADEVHGWSFEIKANESSGSFVYVTFPLDWVDVQGPDAVVKWFATWCSDFGFAHADAGLGFELAWFGEQAQHAYPAILPVALRFHGVRLWQRHHARFKLPGPQTLDTAAWLTYLGPAALQTLGAAAIEHIDAGVLRHPCGKGLVLQAGAKPEPCDTNRRDAAHALLKSVNDAIVPIRTTKWWIGGFAAEPDKENRWFERMDR
ncbi:MAG: DUF3396 domain-containing protein [Nannocystaceae bacterium]|nr:DUF3396 domain-containing protein [Nannocystaceae bacterium]